MPLPSFHVSADRARPWSLARAAAYGAGLGALAGSFKTFGPVHTAGSAHTLEIVGAAAVFALLCVGAALLRNVVAQRFIWPDLR